MEYIVKTFDELTVKEFYELVKLRISVFVVEQNCPYQEIDSIDEQALHAWLLEDDVIVGYTRIFEREDEVAFGRVLVHPSYRKKKVGRRLLKETLKIIEQHYPEKSILINAQAHLVDFYACFDFKVVSEVYLEDNIPHVHMRKV